MLTLALLLAATPVTLPPAAQTAVLAHLGAGPLDTVEQETEAGRTVFEVKARRGGHVVEVTVSAEGQVLGEEREVPLTQTPGFVQAAVARQQPVKVERVEAVTRGQTKSWEAVVRLKDGRRVEVVVQAGGEVAVSPATE